ncbi:MAG TPA: LamG-like jellyroll fold domain-containing protein [Segeticoccus sp.]|uniref:LamG-like jellyroll fold domain-containing protein n=1 Tax=Segeticoccus sp. TaxID=2706531 RepID=UPI002D8088B3|nr:LamG-like jellyroll fold domain-containing protein [Segeticoccus sp.]HET8600721.1 LamG-like jellyroll fold domain-containing protein [Segeticoccus sp.]
MRALIGASGLAMVAGFTGAALPAQAANDPVIAAAGDIACPPGMSQTKTRCHQMETAQLIANGNYAAVLPVGDEQYNCGQLSAFNSLYAPSWGRFNSIAHPVPGDDEYGGGGCSVPGAGGYFSYFGDRATPQQPGCRQSCKGYYSYDIGAWHVVALNSECREAGVGGCAATDPMATWLKQDLAAHPNTCTLAYWHRPYWANGKTVSRLKPVTQILYAGGVDVVLAGHNHIYTRFAPQTPDGKADPNGLRQFTIGTGGRGHSSLAAKALPNTQVRDRSTFGILSLTLHPTSYDFAFVPDRTSGTFTDSGTGQCHGGGAASSAGSTSTTRALWHLDEAPGSTTMIDASGHGNNGTISNVALGAAGYLGRSYSFGGNHSIVRVPDNPSLDPGTAGVTLSAYLRVPSTLGVGDYNVLQKGTATATGGAYKMEVTGRAGKSFGIPVCAFNGANGGKVRVLGPRAINDGKWHKVVCSLTTGSNGRGVVTVDGVAGPSLPRTVDSISNSSPVTVGAKTNNTQNYVGDMDEVSIAIQ